MKRLDSIFIVEKRVIHKDSSSSVWYAIGFFSSEKRALSYMSACEHLPSNDNFVSVSYRVRNVVLDCFEL